MTTYCTLLKLPSFMTVLLKVQGAPAALYDYYLRTKL